MTDPEFDLLECVLKKLSSGERLTRELVADCYQSAGPGDSKESQKVSDGWIELFYEQLSAIPHAELIDAKGSRKKIIDLLHRILT